MTCQAVYSIRSRRRRPNANTGLTFAEKRLRKGLLNHGFLRVQIFSHPLDPTMMGVMCTASYLRCKKAPFSTPSRR